MLRQGIIFVEGTGYQALHEIKCAKSNFDLYVVFVTCNDGRYNEEACNNMSDADVIVKVENLNDIENILRQLPKNIRYIASISFAEDGIVPSALIANALGIIGTSLRASAYLKDKRKQRNIPGIDQPKFREVDLNKSIDIDQTFAAFPWIIKPIDGVGSENVYKVDSLSECIQLLHMLKRAFLNGDLAHQYFLIEEYIIGELISAEYLLCSGDYQFLGITTKYLAGNNGAVEVGGTFPAKHDKKIAVEKMGIDLLRHIEFLDGAAHIEFIVRDGKIYLLEINGRLAGGCVPQMINFSYDCDIVYEIVSLFVFRKLPKKKLSQSMLYSTLRAIYSEGSGTFSRLKFLNDVNPNKFNFFKMRKKLGDKINGLNDNTDRIGFFIICDESEDNSRRIADKLLANIDVIFVNEQSGESDEK